LYASKYNMAYKNISNVMGLNYNRHKCEAVSTDIKVDINKLEKLIQKKLE